MGLRAAVKTDIFKIQRVRNSVKENALSDPALVSDADCEEFLFHRGKGWVYEIDDSIVGFSIADLADKNIWALFVDPAFEGRGIGRQLHDRMLNWYFKQADTVWLGTAPGTRAENFYRKAGWRHTGNHGSKELKFELTRGEWEMGSQRIVGG